MSFTQDVQQMIQNAAARFGISSSYLSTTAQLESGGDVNATSGSAQGLFQFLPGTAAEYGLANPYDPQQSAYAAAALAQNNYNFLSSALGRVPSDAELYLAHQQGAQGALNLITHGSENAASLVGLNAITGNGGTADQTASQFVGMIADKYAAASGQAGTSQAGASAIEGGLGHWVGRIATVIVGFIFLTVGLVWLGRQQQSAPRVGDELRRLNDTLERRTSGGKETVAETSAPKVEPEIGIATRAPKGGDEGGGTKGPEIIPPSKPSGGGELGKTEADLLRNPEEALQVPTLKDTLEGLLSSWQPSGAKQVEGPKEEPLIFKEMQSTMEHYQREMEKAPLAGAFGHVETEELKKTPKGVAENRKKQARRKAKKGGFAAEELAGVVGDPLKDTPGARAESIKAKGPKNMTGHRIRKATVDEINEALASLGIKTDEN